MGRHVGYHQCYLVWDAVGALVWVTYWPGFRCRNRRGFGLSRYRLSWVEDLSCLD